MAMGPCRPGRPGTRLLAPRPLTFTRHRPRCLFTRRCCCRARLSQASRSVSHLTLLRASVAPPCASAPWQGAREGGEDLVVYVVVYVTQARVKALLGSSSHCIFWFLIGLSRITRVVVCYSAVSIFEALGSSFCFCVSI